MNRVSVRRATIRFFTISGAFLLPMICTRLAVAQDAPAGVPVEKAVQDSHYAAAEELLDIMKMEETTKKTIDQMLTVQLQAQPQLAPFRDILKAFMEKHLAYDRMKDDMIKLYKKEFSEDEIEQLTAFYQTPIGRKAIEKLPALASAGAMIGQQRVQANLGELQQAIAQRQAQMGQQAP